MKSRHGFVSNSSSTAFVLDKREEGVEKYIEKCELIGIKPPDSLERSTAIAYDNTLKKYIELILEDALQHWLDGYGFSGYSKLFEILSVVSMLGDDAVFVRDSDEGMGGRLPGRPPGIVYETEYH